MSYLTAVNSVLKRLREPTVTNVTDTPYSTMIGQFVNDSKREIEDSWQWSFLRVTRTPTLAQGDTSTALTGDKYRTRVEAVYNDTNDAELIEIPFQSYQELYRLNPGEGIPVYYAVSFDPGADPSMKVYFYPTIPTPVPTIKIDLYSPQADLSSNSDAIYVPESIVVLGAYLKAIAERGEDTGDAYQQASSQYVGALGSAISLDEARQPGATDWVAV